MGQLNFKMRGCDSPRDKSRVYLCGHPEDFEKFFPLISDALLAAYDCAIYYVSGFQDYDDWEMDLNSMNLIVVPVTHNLLSTENHTVCHLLPLAVQQHIPMIPILLEPGLRTLFAEKFGNLCCIDPAGPNTFTQLVEQLKHTLPAYLSPPEFEGSWVFLSHSSADIEKVRAIRNQFEKNQQNPLAFHLKCLRTDTKEGVKELEGLIKREIDARDWFVFCESEAAHKSTYVTMEKEYVKQRGKKKIWTLDMSLPIEQILVQVDKMCTLVKVYIAYRYKHRHLANILSSELAAYDFDVLYNDMLIPGEDWDISISQQIQAAAQCGFFVAFLFPGDENSYTAQYEIPYAIENNARVIILTVGDMDVQQYLSMNDNVTCYNLPQMPTAEDMYLIAQLIEAEARRRILGPIQQGDAYTAISRIQEQLNYTNRYHPQEAVLVSTEGGLETYEFPCCGQKVTVGEGPVSRFRANGCHSHNEQGGLPMLIDDYKDYLQKLGTLKPGTIDEYARRLQSILKKGYSEQDLLGAVDILMGQYGPNTPAYEKDHGKTYAALKRLNDYIVRSYANTLDINCTRARQVWQPKGKYWVHYHITGRSIAITYSTGSKKTMNIPDSIFYPLVKFIKQNKRYLSDRCFSSLSAAPQVFDYTQPFHFDYSFEEVSGNDCALLFECEDAALQERLNATYASFIEPML